MPELRKDPIIGRWVIISAKRAKRPDHFKSERKAISNSNCPFCPGHENMTPPETYMQSAIDSVKWEIRVFTSNMPFLRDDEEIERRGSGIYDSMNGVGAHEIIVETPNHIANMADLPQQQIEKVFSTYTYLFNKFEKDKRFKYILFYKNYGVDAGGSDIDHAKSQLIATPVIPKRVKEELEGAKSYFQIHERCIFCDLINQEINNGERVIFENNDFLAIAPFASRFPFEAWILPKNHNCDFALIENNQLTSLAQAMKATLSKQKQILGDFPYNYVLHTAPMRHEGSKTSHWKTLKEDFHWHIEIIPRLTKPAGFEWGTGFYICPTLPEKCAEFLREAE